MKTYVILEIGSGRVKIGKTSKDPKARLAMLQTGSSHRLVLLATFVGDIESALHKKFNKHHVRGEWFAPDVLSELFSSVDIAKTLDAITTPNGKANGKGNPRNVKIAIAKRERLDRFDRLAKIEPELKRLLDEAKATDGSAPMFCANSVWYGYGGHPGLKPRLRRLVGWESGLPKGHELRSSKAYDTAYLTIYEALPDCSGDCLCA